MAPMLFSSVPAVSSSTWVQHAQVCCDTLQELKQRDKWQVAVSGREGKLQGKVQQLEVHLAATEGSLQSHRSNDSCSPDTPCPPGLTKSGSPHEVGGQDSWSLDLPVTTTIPKQAHVTCASHTTYYTTTNLCL